MSLSPDDLRRMKSVQRIAMLTCYDYSMAKAFDAAGIHALLVGDSLANVVLGFDSTRHVSMEDMLRHTAAVSRGSRNALVVADMPFGSYDGKRQAIESAERLLGAGARAVKPEGRPQIVKALCKAGVAVLGHTGLLPQTAKSFAVVGGSPRERKRVLVEATALERAGCFALVLECVPEWLGKEITEKLGIPTIGIGAGRFCDGQVLVSYDMLGLFQDFRPRFVKRYANLFDGVKKACQRFKSEVASGAFPRKEHCF